MRDAPDSLKLLGLSDGEIAELRAANDATLSLRTFLQTVERGGPPATNGSISSATWSRVRNPHLLLRALAHVEPQRNVLAAAVVAMRLALPRVEENVRAFAEVLDSLEQWTRGARNEDDVKRAYATAGDDLARQDATGCLLRAAFALVRAVEVYATGVADPTRIPQEQVLLRRSIDAIQEAAAAFVDEDADESDGPFFAALERMAEAIRTAIPSPDFAAIARSKQRFPGAPWGA